MGITLARARSSLEAVVGPARPATELNTGRSPSATTALEHAIADSLWRKHHYTGTEHLMFALLTDRTCAAVSLLEHLGADQYALEDEMIAAADPARDAATGNPAIPADDRLPTARRPNQSARMSRQRMRSYMRLANMHRAIYTLGTPEAERLNHGYVGTEHMLLAMLTADEPITRLLLGEHGLTRERTLPAVEEVIGRDEGEILGDRSMTRRLFRAFDDVVDENERTGQRRMGMEVLLNAMLRQEEGAAISVLRHLGVDLDLLRSHVADVARPAEETPKVMAEVGAGPKAEADDWLSARVTSVTRSHLKQKAREETTRLRHARTGTAHFLLVLVRSGDRTVQSVLAEAGITRVKVRTTIEQLVEPVDDWLVGSGTYSLRTVRILERADRERERCGHESIRQSHVLLAMLGDDSCTAAKALDLIGIDRAELRRRLIERLHEPARPDKT